MAKRKGSEETLEKVLSGLLLEAKYEGFAKYIVDLTCRVSSLEEEIFKLHRSLDDIKYIVYGDNVALDDVIRQVNDIVEKYHLFDENIEVAEDRR